MAVENFVEVVVVQAKVVHHRRVIHQHLGVVNEVEVLVLQTQLQPLLEVLALQVMESLHMRQGSMEKEDPE